MAIEFTQHYPTLDYSKVISKFDDIVFVSSMKYAMGVFFFPIWWFGSGLALAYALEIQ